MDEIIPSCYHHYDLDPETYVQQDPDESSQERSIIPEELRPQPPPSGSPAGRLLPDPRRKQVGHTANEDENEKEEDCVEEEQERRARKKQKSLYDPSIAMIPHHWPLSAVGGSATSYTFCCYN